ncbi:unnamed protein product [Rotaria sp. Silwood1]|nr:unnamed protein product [Rotaria sp. Silwood1]
MSDKSASQGHWEAHSHAAKSTKIGDNPAIVTGKEASAEGTFDDVVEVDSVVDFVANVVNIGVVGVDAVADVVEVDSVVHVDNVVSVADIVRVDSVADVVDVDSVIDVDDVDSVVDVVDIDSVIDSVIDPILDAINDYVVNSDSVIGAIADIVSVACVVDVDGFNDVLVTTSDGTVASTGEVPVFDRIKSSLCEYRSFQHPPVSKSLSTINVPDQLTRTLMGHKFLFYNNRQAPILAFAAPKAIQLLDTNAHWNRDSTFLTAFRLFYQSYSIHIWNDYRMKPTKKGSVNLSDNDEARRQIAYIIMLPLLPPQEMNEAFSNIIEAISNIHHKFLKLTDYILRTYIEEELLSQ